MDAPEREDSGRFAVRNGLDFLANQLEPLDPARLRDQADLTARLARRAASSTPSRGLAAMAALRYNVERLELLSVVNARRLGWSWGTIAEALGISKQVLHRRYAELTPRPRRRRKTGSATPYARRRRPG